MDDAARSVPSPASVYYTRETIYKMYTRGVRTYVSIPAGHPRSVGLKIYYGPRIPYEVYKNEKIRLVVMPLYYYTLVVVIIYVKI